MDSEQPQEAAHPLAVWLRNSGRTGFPQNGISALTEGTE